MGEEKSKYFLGTKIEAGLRPARWSFRIPLQERYYLLAWDSRRPVFPLPALSSYREDDGLQMAPIDQTADRIA